MYGNGVRPARKTWDGRGRWKASTASKEVEQKVVCNDITFCRSVLNYFEGVPCSFDLATTMAQRPLGP